eukprot:1217289-Amphidinium_carterae.1
MVHVIVLWRTVTTTLGTIVVCVPGCHDGNVAKSIRTCSRRQGKAILVRTCIMGPCKAEESHK